ncbi:MAG: enoyl-CoA hydratase-related protein, partial [Hyphomicrobium sp.]
MSQNLESLKHWRYEVDREKITWVSFNREGSSANALGRAPLEELGLIINHVNQNYQGQQLKGLVFLSAKEKSFIVGADINEFESLHTEDDVVAQIKGVNALFDKIEHLSIPVIAAVHGVCVGGGLEFILACHYRIATRDPATRFGFPEVKLGIFPGFNGTARSIKQIGPLNAMKLMLSGSMVSAQIARAQGLVDALVGSADSLRWAARKAILSHRHSSPAKLYKSFLCFTPFRQLLVHKLRSETSKKIREEHYPAPFRLIDLFEKYGGSYQKMKDAETLSFAPLMISEQSKNLRRVFKLSESLKAQAPKSLKWKPKRVHVIGAGTMGADIAGVCASSGMEVTLQDISRDQIEKGIRSQYKFFSKKFKTKASFEAAKTRLIFDQEGKGISRADVIIEAIVEKIELKQKLFKEIEG